MSVKIDSAVQVHTLINTFTVQPERQLDVVASLRTFTEQHARLMPGFVGAAVHASLDGTRVVNYAQWQSADDLKRMLSTPVAHTHMAEVAEFSKAVQPVFYRVAYVGA